MNIDFSEPMAVAYHANWHHMDTCSPMRHALCSSTDHKAPQLLEEQFLNEYQSTF